MSFDVPILRLGSSGFRNEAFFKAWMSQVQERLAEECGFTVLVEASPFRGYAPTDPGFDDYMDGSDFVAMTQDEHREVMRALHRIWERDWEIVDARSKEGTR